jgi:hypothetical protein
LAFLRSFKREEIRREKRPEKEKERDLHSLAIREKGKGMKMAGKIECKRAQMRKSSLKIKED